MQASISEHRGGRGNFAMASALRDAESGACHTGWTGIVCLCADELAEPNCETAKSAVFGEISDF